MQNTEMKGVGGKWDDENSGNAEFPGVKKNDGQASMAKPSLRRRDGRLVDTKADPLLRSLHGGRGPPVRRIVGEDAPATMKIHFTPPMKRNKPSGKL
jgi:hypothetical protein